MRIQKIQLVQFKRFDDLTIDLGSTPAKIVALLGPNGCGKSSVFDAFEQKMKNFRNKSDISIDFYSKAIAANGPANSFRFENDGQANTDHYIINDCANPYHKEKQLSFNHFVHGRIQMQITYLTAYRLLRQIKKNPPGFFCD